MTPLDHWIYDPVEPPSDRHQAEAEAHQSQLTKPPGSLGQLEQLAQLFCAMQSTVSPSLDNVNITVFAGDHGVCAQNISAFPQAVTAQMLLNFSSGGAAICVLAREFNAQFCAVNVGTVQPLPNAVNLIDSAVAPGTEDFTEKAAMSEQHCLQALDVGRVQVTRAQAGSDKAHLLIGGEMGIGNTTSAAAIYCAQLGCEPAAIVGPGTGLDSEGLIRKRKAVQAGLDRHRQQNKTPLDILQTLGGFEIAALVGFYIASAQTKTPALVDGYICASAALIAVSLNPSVRPWLMFSHCSAEPGHKMVLEALAAKPILNLGLRLGEASGAAMCVPILRSALALHNQMATFADAGVSRG